MQGKASRDLAIMRYWEGSMSTRSKEPLWSLSFRCPGVWLGDTCEALLDLVNILRAKF